MSTLTEWEKDHVSLIDQLESSYLDASMALKALEGIEEIYSMVGEHTRELDRDRLHALLNLIVNRFRESLGDIHDVYEKL